MLKRPQCWVGSRGGRVGHPLGAAFPFSLSIVINLAKELTKTQTLLCRSWSKNSNATGQVALSVDIIPWQIHVSHFQSLLLS